MCFSAWTCTRSGNAGWYFWNLNALRDYLYRFINTVKTDLKSPTFKFRWVEKWSKSTKYLKFEVATGSTWTADPMNIDGWAIPARRLCTFEYSSIIIEILMGCNSEQPQQWKLAYKIVDIAFKLLLAAVSSYTYLINWLCIQIIY